MNRTRRADFDNVYADLFAFQRQPQRYQQVRPSRRYGWVVDQEIYVGGERRDWTTWFHVLAFLTFILILAAAIMLSGGTFYLGPQK